MLVDIVKKKKQKFHAIYWNSDTSLLREDIGVITPNCCYLEHFLFDCRKA